MLYKSVKLPADFVDEIKLSATKEYRSVAQQIQYLASLGKTMLHDSTLTDEVDDAAFGELALERYKKEKHLAVRVSLDDL